MYTVDVGGVWVICSPRDPSFVRSNPAELDRFFLREELELCVSSLKFSGPLKNLEPEKSGM